jgi:acyl-CoA synthetase (AMP-forming)/AMP-acid ligase II
MDSSSSNQSPTFSTIVDLLRFRAEKQPGQRSYTFLVDGEEEEEHINYGELDSSARMIAAFLQSQGATGQRVLLLYPPGLDYIKAFLGCLYAGATAVPVYPPRLSRLTDRSFPRLLAIAHDAHPVFVLTTAPILALAEGSRSLISDFPQVEWKATDTFDRNLLAEAWQDPKVKEDTLAFLQYTSGSTSSPKGVMVSHWNLVQNQMLIQHAFGLNQDSLGVCWLPLYHDMGLIGNVLQPLYTGFPCVMMSPIDFLQKPFRWLGAISRYHATVSGGPNFAYELCMSRITAEQRASLDLSSWSLAYTAAEPIREETIERFSKAFEPCGFRKDSFFPGYGLAEATLCL